MSKETPQEILESLCRRAKVENRKAAIYFKRDNWIALMAIKKHFKNNRLPLNAIVNDAVRAFLDQPGVRKKIQQWEQETEGNNV